MKLPSSFKNWISITGATLAIFNLAAIVALFILNTFWGFGGTYIGLFIYIVLPGIMIFGLILIPVGMRINREKARKAEKEGRKLPWPILDFNNTATRNATIIFVVGTIVLVIISAIGSYEAFHYTESVEFCGKLCHDVMEPEYTTYHGSAHERVACVECHVGSGANWYVRSKLSGLYQVYSVLANKYPQPIPTPIENLRPAQETCEECHWPEKFYDHSLREKHVFLADEQNTEHVYKMQIKTSTRTVDGKMHPGIHQHISPDVIIEYKTASHDRQVIPWVRYRNTRTGETKVYTDSETMLGEAQMDSIETRVMDCIDCHNRPSHDYEPPQNFIDEKLAHGKISASLPSIKLVAMMALYQDYPTKDSAFYAIETQVNDWYESGYPETWEQNQEQINTAIAEIQDGYANNIFPYMNANWKVYPNNISHMESDGCFRCHNDKHASASGEVISKDCNLCHDILAQGTADSLVYAHSFEPLEFEHPADVGDAWETEFCSMCHAALY